MTIHRHAEFVSGSSDWRRWLPAVVLAVAIAVAYVSGVQNYLSLTAVAQHRDELKGFVTDHLVLALLAYAGLYVVSVALSLPGAALLSIIGGFLFGWMISAPVSIASATLGAIIVFEIVRTSIGVAATARAGPYVKSLAEGFAKDAFSYLIFLRLTPVVPFFAVNAVAGLCNVALSTFALATLVGIIPGGIAYAYLGEGLDGVIDAQLAAHAACVAEKGESGCALVIDPGALITTQMLVAFAALGAVALVPVLLRRWKSP